MRRTTADDYRDLANKLVDQRKEIKRLNDLLQWCAPRLKSDEYRALLWDYRKSTGAVDHTPIVQ